MPLLQSEKNQLKSLVIQIPDTDQVLSISPKALERFKQSRQISRDDKETGGILLAQISKEKIHIVEATRAKAADSISRYLFKPNLVSKRSLIKRAFREGKHFIGEWHTHPEEIPTASTVDRESMKDSFIKSKHELDSFVMVIVGNKKQKLSLTISLHTESRQLSLGNHLIAM